MVIDGFCFYDGGELRRDVGVKYCVKVGLGLIFVSLVNMEFFFESILGLFLMFLFLIIYINILILCILNINNIVN